MRRQLFAASLALSLAACVPQAEHDDLKRELDSARTALSQLDAHVGGLEREREKNLAQLERYREELEAAHREAEAMRRDLEMTAVQRDARATELANAMKDQAALEESIEAMTRALAEANERELAAQQRVYEFKRLLKRFQKLIDAGKLRIKIVDGRMVLELPTDILFASGSAKFSPEGEAALQEVGAVLSEMADRKFQVEGHTDNVPIDNRKFANNWELAAGRALGVRDTLEAAGMKPTQLSAASFGETRPVADNGSEAGKAANRRIEIVLVPDLSALPGAEELKRAGGGG